MDAHGVGVAAEGFDEGPVPRIVDLDLAAVPGPKGLKPQIQHSAAGRAPISAMHRASQYRARGGTREQERWRKRAAGDGANK